jgi:predicted small lipoprotein YifL
VALNDRRILMRALVAGTLVAALALSACGRRGGLEPPPGATAYDADPAVTDPVEAKKAEKPDRPFFLDWLL